jgi:hypothetical protein
MHSKEVLADVRGGCADKGGEVAGALAGSECEPAML